MEIEALLRYPVQNISFISSGIIREVFIILLVGFPSRRHPRGLQLQMADKQWNGHIGRLVVDSTTRETLP